MITAFKFSTAHASLMPYRLPSLDLFHFQENRGKPEFLSLSEMGLKVKIGLSY